MNAFEITISKMGVTICRVHGKTSLLPVCEHLLQNMIENSRPTGVTPVTYNYGNFFGKPNCPVFDGFLYCRDCRQKYDLPENSCALPGADAEAVPWDEIKVTCGRCFDEFLTNYEIVWSGFTIESP